MTATTQALKNDDSTSVGTLVMHSVTSPATGSVGMTSLVTISGATATDISSSNGLPTILLAGTAEIGNVKNSGTFVIQIDGTALTRLTDIETNTDFGAVTGGGVQASALRVTIASDSSGVLSIDDNGGVITTDGSITVGAENVSAPSDAQNVQAFNRIWDGSAWDRMPGTSADGVTVNLGSNNDVVATNAGTFVVQEDGAALTALQLIDDAIYVDDADWTNTSSKHMLVGGLYQSTPQTVTDGDVAPFQVDVNGNAVINQGNRISTTSFNSRDAATLTSGSTFQGVGEDVSKYGRVGVSIVSDNATDGVLTMEVSRDNVTWGGPTRTWADTRFAQPHMWNIVEKYFRIKYVNGSIEATNLAIQVQYSNNADIFLGHQLNETLLNETEGIVTRSVLVGQDPNSAYVNAGVPGVDNNNSSTTNLTSGTSLVFTGTWSRVDGYHGITVLIDGTSSGDVAGTLLMQFSHDGSTVHRSISIATSTITNVLPRTLGVVAKYFRIVYTAASDLITFDAQTMLHNEQVQLVSRLDGTLQGTEDVANVRAVLVGQDPDDAYINIQANSFGALDVEPEQHVDLDEMEAVSGWTALNTDTTTIATSTNHIKGMKSLSFAKVNGAANTAFGIIQKTITAVDLGDVSPHDLFQLPTYVSSTADILYAIIRVGTDNSNYNEWRIDGADLAGGDWSVLLFNVGDASFAGSTGNGWDHTAITYIAVGYEFNAETDALSGILVDGLSFHTNQHTSASLNSEVTSSVNSSNINVQKVGNKVVNTEAGTVGTGTQRFTLASNDPAVTALQLLDNAISGSGYNITQMNGVNVTMGNGAAGTGVQRVSIANDSTGILAGVTTVTTVTNLAQMGGVAISLDTGVRDTGTQRVTIATDDVVPVTGTLTAVTTLTGSAIAHDAADSGNPHKIGAKATTSLAANTMVADNDRTDLMAGTDGVAIVRQHCNLEDIVSGNANTTGATSISVIAAAGSGIKQYLTSITLTNTSSTDTYCEIKSGSTVRWVFPVPANGGVTHTWNPPLPPNAANEAWNFDMGASVTTAYASMTGFKSKV